MSCYHPEDGGFGASPRNDSHLLATLSALQILALLDALGSADTDAVAACEESSCSHTLLGVGRTASAWKQQCHQRDQQHRLKVTHVALRVC
jgi:hypothetical protein